MRAGNVETAVGRAAWAVASRCATCQRLTPVSSVIPTSATPQNHATLCWPKGAMTAAAASGLSQYELLTLLGKRFACSGPVSEVACFKIEI